MAGSSIFLSKLKNKDDAFFITKDDRAVTVSGCWNKTTQKAIIFRKKDNKMMDVDINEYQTRWRPIYQ